jgi:pimeloyl-ACP methyl ester carboxylesterase
VLRDWPGEAVFPPQPQVSQTRAVFERRKAHGGSVRELVLQGVGHGPLIERADEVARVLVAHLTAAASPAPG